MFGFGKCKHKNVSAVQSDGYQYCNYCNKAIYSAPLKPEKRCNHEHLTPIQPDGYQYCLECNIAIPASPIKEDTSCGHQWEKEQIYIESNAGRTKSYQWIFKCTKCGLRSIHTTDDDEWYFPD